MKTYTFPTPDNTNWKLICEEVSVGETCVVSYENLTGEDNFLRDEETHFVVTSPGYPDASVCLDNNFQHLSTSAGF